MLSTPLQLIRAVVRHTGTAERHPSPRLVSLSHTKQAISVDGRKSQTRSSRAGWGIKHSQGKTFFPLLITFGRAFSRRSP